jgi:hypothetical protein
VCGRPPPTAQGRPNHVTARAGWQVVNAGELARAAPTCGVKAPAASQAGEASTLRPRGGPAAPRGAKAHRFASLPRNNGFFSPSSSCLFFYFFSFFPCGKNKLLLFALGGVLHLQGSYNNGFPPWSTWNNFWCSTAEKAYELRPGYPNTM